MNNLEFMTDKNLSRLEALIQGLTVAVLVENEKREVIYVNSAFEEMFSVKSEQIMGANCGDLLQQSLVAFNNPDIIGQEIIKLLEERKVNKNVLVKMKDGRVLLRDYIPVDLDEESLGNMWIYKDITEDENLKSDLTSKMEQLEQMNKYMTDRELKMIELKEENEALRKKLNE